MKKGKTAKITGYKRAKVMYGTVDSVELKSLYLNLHTWVNPKEDSDNWERIVLNMSRKVKHLVLETIKDDIFSKKFIVKEIVNNIFKYEFNNNKYFEFHLTKSNNKEKVLTETGIT